MGEADNHLVGRTDRGRPPAGELTGEERIMRRGSSALLVGVLVAALVLVAGTAVLWSRQHAPPPASVPAAPATRPPPEPATLQQLVDKVVAAGAPGGGRPGPHRPGNLAGRQRPGGPGGQAPSTAW